LEQTAVQRFYRYHAYIYDKTRWMILHGRRRAAERLALRPDSRVLEVGCGTGLNFRYVLEPLDPQRGRLVGLDFSHDMLARAQHRVSARGWQNVELVQADATQMELGRTFDAILFAYSLTMIPDWEAALRRARAHLAPGGRVVVLDFSTFRGWGPLGPVMRWWLRSNHVETTRPYADGLRRVFPTLQVSQWLGGYNFTAVGRRGD
jgi:ubiquinone/menaquinone biosynthesis C-methylase UbiE